MTVLAIASSKGGVGKTTTVAYLANYLGRRFGPGHIAIVDRDETRNLTAMFRQYPRRLPVNVELVEGTDIPVGYDHVIVDTPPRFELAEYLRGVDLVVVPAPPESQVVASLGEYLERVWWQCQGTNLRLIAILPTMVQVNRMHRLGLVKIAEIAGASATAPRVLSAVPRRVGIARWDMTAPEYDAPAKEVFEDDDFSPPVAD